MGVSWIGFWIFSLKKKQTFSHIKNFFILPLNDYDLVDQMWKQVLEGLMVFIKHIQGSQMLDLMIVQRMKRFYCL